MKSLDEEQTSPTEVSSGKDSGVERDVEKKHTTPLLAEHEKDCHQCSNAKGWLDLCSDGYRLINPDAFPSTSVSATSDNVDIANTHVALDGNRYPVSEAAPERIWTVGGTHGHFFESQGNFATVEYARVHQPPEQNLEDQNSVSGAGDCSTSRIPQDSLESADQENGDELRRWQDAIRDRVIIKSGAPDYSIDGAGCDSGDPLDLTLAEIDQGFNFIDNEFYDAINNSRPGFDWPEGKSAVQVVMELLHKPSSSDVLGNPDRRTSARNEPESESVHQPNVQSGEFEQTKREMTDLVERFNLEWAKRKEAEQEVARLRAAASPAQADEVSKALEELREIVPHKCEVAYLTSTNKVRVTVWANSIIPMSLFTTYGKSLSEAIAKVREWKERQTQP